ncbi:MAG TPA: YihY/virulence factor BrkB family protein [Mycobacteriales bacterium]|nr:YihY/virulence factor BrkB family protein [Mycobacteriales bacterium]
MKLFDNAKVRLGRARERRPWLDHLVRAAGRYKADAGDRLAASLTFYAFLSLFPLALLGVSVLGFALNGREELQDEIFTSLVGAVPGLADTFAENLEAIRTNAGKTGIAALIGVLLAGLGGVTSLRDSLRLMWHQNPAQGNFVTGKLHSVVTLLVLGVTLLASIAVTTIASSLLGNLLDAVGIGSSRPAKLLAGTFALGLALGADLLMFLYIFRRLPKVDWPLRRVVRGALFASVGFGVLKYIATFYVGRAVSSNSELYGPVGAVIGILVGLNLICRFILFSAAWTVTAPGSDDVLPSATASPAAAARSGGTATPDGPATPDPRGTTTTSVPQPRRTAAGVAARAEARVSPSSAGRAQVAAGVTLGALATTTAFLVAKGLRSVWGAVRPS